MKKEETFEKIYKSWCKEHQILPSGNSLDPIEKRLGTWRNKNRKWEVLIEFNSQLNSKYKSKEKVFKEEYIPWVLENNKLPSQYSSNPIEKKLGKWRYHNNDWKKLIEFNSQFKFRECKPKEKVFTEDYIPWVLENNKLPSKESSDSIEKKLGIWRNTNRKWNKLTQFNILFSYSMEGNSKAKELLEKMMH